MRGRTGGTNKGGRAQQTTEALLRTESGSMLRTRSGALLIVDERRWLLLLLPALVALFFTLEYLLTSTSAGSSAGAASAASAAAARLAAPLPSLERTVLRRPEEYSNVTEVLRMVPAVVILDDLLTKSETDHIIRFARPL